MKNERLDTLIHEHLDGHLSMEEQAEFEQMLQESAAARHRFWELAEVHGLAREASRMAWDEPTQSVVPTEGNSFQTNHTLWWRSLGAVIRPLAAGILIGGFSVSVAWAYVAPRAQDFFHKGSVILADSFESAQQPLSAGVPAMADVWGGDFSKVTMEEQGIVPAQGKQMLRFDRPDNELTPKGAVAHVAEIWQVVDLRARRSEWGARPFVLEASAKINAVSLSPDQRYAFGLGMQVFRGELSQMPALWKNRMESALVSSDKEELVDREPGTWQTLGNQVTVPPDADFLLLQLRVTRKSRAQAEPSTFPGHYADDVILRVRPSSPAP
ncbi:MAG: hypothetical protein RL693_2168 [Verrucomicrobiota bacterium]|jgi:hypothetical protein